MPWQLLLVTMMTMMTGQDHHRAMNERGAMVMGFDQEKTIHHFHLYRDGGAIDIAVKEASDAKNRDAIRAHLPHIASMFAAGNFGAPMIVHHTAAVPGTGILKERSATNTCRRRRAGESTSGPPIPPRWRRCTISCGIRSPIIGRTIH
jgi:hypothetical protein